MSSKNQLKVIIVQDKYPSVENRRPNTLYIVQSLGNATLFLTDKKNEIKQVAASTKIESEYVSPIASNGVSDFTAIKVGENEIQATIELKNGQRHSIQFEVGKSNDTSLPIRVVRKAPEFGEIEPNTIYIVKNFRYNELKISGSDGGYELSIKEPNSTGEVSYLGYPGTIEEDLLDAGVKVFNCIDEGGEAQISIDKLKENVEYTFYKFGMKVTFTSSEGNTFIGKTEITGQAGSFAKVMRREKKVYISVVNL